MPGKINQAYRYWFVIKESSGVPATGVAGGDITVTVRNPSNTATMSAPTVTEVSNGLYFFDIAASFTSTYGVGTYGGSIVINSTSPAVDDTLLISIEFNNIDVNDLLDVRYDSSIGPAVWIDTFYGSPGTVVGVNGTSDNPVNNEADAYTLAVALGYRSYFIRAGSITLSSGSSIAYQDWHFAGIGAQTAVTINNKNVWGSKFRDTFILGTFNVSGNEGFDIEAYNCDVGACTNITGRLNSCGIHSTLTMPASEVAFGSSGGLTLMDCRSVNTHEFPARISAPASDAPAFIRVQNYVGRMTLQNFSHPLTEMDASFNSGHIVIEDTNVSGYMTLHGIYELEDEHTSPTLEVEQEGNVAYLIDGYLTEQHGAGEWETATVAAPISPTLEGHSVIQMNANPGQTVSLTTQVLDANGERIDGYVPQVDYVIVPGGTMSSGFPLAMANLTTGVYSTDITIPSGASAIGTYIVSISWMRPGASQTQYEVHLINVALPFGNSSVSPA